MADQDMYLYGAGGHSNVIRDVLNSNGVSINGIFDDDSGKIVSCGCKVNRGIEVLGTNYFTALNSPLIISIGDSISRAVVARKLNCVYGNAIHASAIIAPDVSIGEGTVVLHGAIVQTGTTVGKHVLINTSASIDHDNILEDYVSISPHATLCGHVEVGEGTQIGAGAVIIPKVKVGKWCIIGAGAVIIRDIPDYSVAVGNPARILEGKSVAQKDLICAQMVTP